MMKQQFYVRQKRDGVTAKVLEYRPGERSYYYDVIRAEVEDEHQHERGIMFIMVTQNFNTFYELFYEWEDGQ